MVFGDTRIMVSKDRLSRFFLFEVVRHLISRTRHFRELFWQFFLHVAVFDDDVTRDFKTK